MGIRIIYVKGLYRLWPDPALRCCCCAVVSCAGAGEKMADMSVGLSTI